MLKNGDLLDNTYKIIEQIGSGGSGIVYKAEHIRLQKEVVVKLIRENIKGKLNDRAEADILKKLKHMYLPQVYDFLTIEENVYTIMDFIPGRSFEEEIKKGRKFTQKEVIKWAGQLCEALKYLHEQNPPIIHSDIKPANIMLTPSDDICLIDFNISLVFDENDNSALGKSDGYSPPEQYLQKNQQPLNIDVDNTNYTQTILASETNINEIEVSETVSLDESNMHLSIKNHISHKPKVDEQSDIYSLGATIYHLATGEKPNISINGVKHLDKCEVELSDGLKYIITKAIEVNPKDRFKSASEILNAVRNINKLDKRYKTQVVKQKITSFILLAFLCISSFMTYKGYDTMGIEKADKYYSLINESQQTMNSGDYDKAIAKANSAILVLENKIDAYYIISLSLMNQGKYDECIEYIENVTDIPFSIESHNDQFKRADMDFIIANALFYKENYSEAIKYYEKAIAKNETNSQYYRDYAISLAKTQKMELADSVLAKAFEKGLDDEGIMMIKGEIALINKDYLNAESAFKNILEKTDNISLRERVYITCAKMYKETSSNIENSLDKEVTILEESIERLPIDKNIVATEMLGDAYVRKAQLNDSNKNFYYEEAVNCFLELLNRGYGRFYVMNNIAIIYQNMGEYQKSEDMLIEMSRKFIDDYRVYMQLAFLYADIQQTIANDQRNYDAVYKNYQIAVKYYTDNMKDNETNLQMDMLKGLIDDIKSGGWVK